MRDGFWGYRRSAGGYGIRNHLLLLGINGLAARATEKIGLLLPQAVTVASRSGRGLIEPDRANHQAQMIGLALNPNVGAVLVVGVDAETTQHIEAVVAGQGKPVASVSFAETHEDALAVIDLGLRRAAGLLWQISRQQRVQAPASELRLAVECGHSDATSGMVANPLIGAVADRLIDLGGSVIIGETVEWLGAEHLLSRRARTPAVAEQLTSAVSRREAMVIASGASLTGNNPGEENIRGGLSTIEEKALGAVAKAGSRPIEAVLGLNQPPPGPGLYLMDGPSFSPDSMTGFVAAGAQVILFSTGPGNSYASAVAPTVKLSGHAGTARHLPGQIDFDASPVFTGAEALDASAERLLVSLAEVASGALTWAEIFGEGLEVPTRLRESL